MDQLPYPCPAEGALVTLLHPYGIDAWSRQQAVDALEKGRVAVLPIVLSEVQTQAYFPPQGPVHVSSRSPLCCELWLTP